ncbi:MAG: OmpA family protein [Bacteroidetes bacterium]|nr:OmpA family protein [Bacteroidota bacterium]
MLCGFSLSEDLILQAGVNYHHPSGSSIYDAKLETSSLGLTFSLLYEFGTEKEVKPEKPVPVDTPKVVEPVIVKKVPQIEINPSPIEVLETIVTQTYPILPYIFFDSSSYQLKSRYIPSRSGSFDEKKLPNETLKIYYSLLDIIGSRLKANPQSELIITGMSDGRELETTDKRLEIAKKRAESVAEYFSNNWQIDNKRLKLKTRETPELATNTIYEEGYEENRRVEIYSPDFEILKPVIYSRFSEYELMSQDINTSINWENADRNYDPKLSLYAGNEEIASMIVNIADTSALLKFDDNQKKILVRSLNNGNVLKIKYEYDYNGKNFVVEKNPILKKNENQFEIGRLNLIVFDFDKSEVNQLNSELIKNFVANSIEDNSKVDIIGSTDKLGEKDYNLALSKSRAENTYNFIKEIKPKADFHEIKGIGDSELLYDNLQPEGRFYCRTVLIEVTTPVK